MRYVIAVLSAPLFVALVMAAACAVMRWILSGRVPVLYGCGVSVEGGNAGADVVRGSDGALYTNRLPLGTRVYYAPWMVWICGLGRARNAVTIGRQTIIVMEKVGARTLVHEAEHLQQWWLYGVIGFPVLYVYGALLALSFGPRHFLEAPAYAAGAVVPNGIVWSRPAGAQ